MTPFANRSSRILEERTIVRIYHRNIFDGFAFPLGVGRNDGSSKEHDQER